jgi:hypothetical protein
MAANSPSLFPESACESRSQSPIPIQIDADAEPPHEVDAPSHTDMTTHGIPTRSITASRTLVRDNKAHARSQLYRLLQKPSVARNPDQAYEIFRFLVNRVYMGVDGAEQEGWQLFSSDRGDTGPSSDHRQINLSDNNYTAQPNSLQWVLCNDTSGPASSHRREVSNISDFAYAPGDSGFKGESPSEEIRIAVATEEPLTLFNIARNRPLHSTETTAVNTTRNSSDSSVDDFPFNQPDGESTQWVRLREVVAAAQPGVNVTINVYTGSLPPRRGDAGESTQDFKENKPREIIQIERVGPPSSTWKQTTITRARTLLAPWLPVCFAGRATLVFIFEMTFMAAFVGAIIAIVWLILAVVAHLLELQFPSTHETTTITKFKTDPPSTCPVPSPFQDVAPTCSLSRWQRWYINGTNLSTSLFLLVATWVLVVDTLKRARRNRNEEQMRRLQLAEMVVNEPLDGLTRRRPIS